jgi:hypothetical protein
MRRTIGFCFIVLLLICGNQVWAQDHAPIAPLGQKLVDELLARHQLELLGAALHVVPPGGDRLDHCRCDLSYQNRPEVQLH